MLHRRLFALGMLTVLVASGGCGGMDYDPDEFDSQYPDLTFALRIQDPDGNAIGSVRVWVDGERDYWWSEADYEALGSVFPSSWRGYMVNWVNKNYQILSPIGSGPTRFDLAVRKTGWTEAVTVVQIDETNAQHYFVRDVLTLYPAGGGPANPPLQYAEVVEGPAPPLE